MMEPVNLIRFPARVNAPAPGLKARPEKEVPAVKLLVFDTRAVPPKDNESPASGAPVVQLSLSVQFEVLAEPPSQMRLGGEAATGWVAAPLDFFLRLVLWRSSVGGLMSR